MLDVYILRRDPSCFSEVGLVWINLDRHPGEVTFPGDGEEWERVGIFGTKIVSEWRKHCDESVAPMHQRKGAELVKNIYSVGNGGKKLADIPLINTLGEGSDDTERCSGIRAKFLE